LRLASIGTFDTSLIPITALETSSYAIGQFVVIASTASFYAGMKIADEDVVGVSESESKYYTVDEVRVPGYGSSLDPIGRFTFTTFAPGSLIIAIQCNCPCAWVIKLVNQSYNMGCHHLDHTAPCFLTFLIEPRASRA